MKCPLYGVIQSKCPARVSKWKVRRVSNANLVRAGFDHLDRRDFVSRNSPFTSSKSGSKDAASNSQPTVALPGGEMKMECQKESGEVKPLHVLEVRAVEI